MNTFIVDEESVGLRADIVVARLYPNHSRSTIAKLFKLDYVKMDDNHIKPGEKLKLGQKIMVDDKILLESPSKIDLPILYEDDNVIVINKPAGVLTHSKGGLSTEGTVATFIEPVLDKSIQPSNRAGIVHRLDRATSGVIICAKNEQTYKLLQKQFAQRKTKKSYLAVVEGTIQTPELEIDAPILRNPKRPQAFVVNVEGKNAHTNLELIEILNKSSISKTMALSKIRLKPTTGRTHQLRVHLKYIGHPIVGDRVYGNELKESPNMLLHAESLELTLPGGDRRVFSAPIPEYFP